MFTLKYYQNLCGCSFEGKLVELGGGMGMGAMFDPSAALMDQLGGSESDEG